MPRSQIIYCAVPWTNFGLAVGPREPDFVTFDQIPPIKFKRTLPTKAARSGTGCSWASLSFRERPA